MRLSKFEQNVIKKTAEDIFGKNTAVYIFGSRTDEKCRGGDIDIYIKCSNDTYTLQDKIRYVVELEKVLGMQKIDVIINDQSRKVKPIFRVAEETGIRL